MDEVTSIQYIFASGEKLNGEHGKNILFMRIVRLHSSGKIVASTFILAFFARLSQI